MYERVFSTKGMIMKSCEFKVKSESCGCVISLMKDMLSDDSKVYSVIVESVDDSAEYPPKQIEISVEDYDRGIELIECLEKNAYGIE